MNGRDDKISELQDHWARETLLRNEIRRLTAIIEAIRADEDIGCYVSMFEKAVDEGKTFTVIPPEEGEG